VHYITSTLSLKLPVEKDVAFQKQIGFKQCWKFWMLLTFFHKLTTYQQVQHFPISGSSVGNSVGGSEGASLKRPAGEYTICIMQSFIAVHCRHFFANKPSICSSTIYCWSKCSSSSKLRPVQKGLILQVSARSLLSQLSRLMGCLTKW